MKVGRKSVTFNLNSGSSHKGAEFVNSDQNQIGRSGAAYLDGLYGSFVPTLHDFSLINSPQHETYYRDEPHLNEEQRWKIRRFRFVVCILGLVAAALCFASRVILNVAIVEMVREPHAPIEEPVTELNDQLFTSATAFFDDLEPYSAYQVHDLATQPTTSSSSSAGSQAASTLIGDPSCVSAAAAAAASLSLDEHPGTVSGSEGAEQEEASVKIEELDGLKFDWTRSQQNMIISSFFFGYAPCMLVSGGLADTYGSKVLIFICMAFSGVASLLTPTAARYSYGLLLTLRVLMGASQGSLMPACFDLFNRWLTPAEKSIFAPIIKISVAFGCLAGMMLPALMDSFGFKWPTLFYLASGWCLIFCLFWLVLATNSPETNRFVVQSETEKVRSKLEAAREQVPPVPKISVIDTDAKHEKEKEKEKEKELELELELASVDKKQVPWLRIITHPSVIVLALAKFAYNLSLDFVVLIMPSYLKIIHGSSIQLISLIAGAGLFLQIVLAIPVAWMAKVVVQNRAFGLSVTKWRKLFLGSALFIAGSMYFLLIAVSDNLMLVFCIITTVCLAYMLGAGSEPLLPYDLSDQYPATIMGLVHSFSVLSSITLPNVSSLLLGDADADPKRWNLVFIFTGSCLIVGGLLFVLFVKAKPFLPGEKRPKMKLEVLTH